MSHTNLKPKSIGIDVSKRRLDVACIFSDRHIENISVDNTETGIVELIAWMKTHGTAETVPCVIESTGDLHLLCSLMLTQAGYTVNCVNPLITKKYEKSSIRGAKTDRIDAERMAEIGMTEASLPLFTATRQTIAARKLLASKRKLEHVRQQLRLHIKQLRETVESLGLPLKETVQGLESTLSVVDEQLACVNTTITHAVGSRSTELSSHLKGVSAIQSAALMTFFAGRSFSTDDQLVAFVGLDVRARESGAWIGQRKLTKRGDPFIRKILFQVGWGLSMHHPYYQCMYEERRKLGRTHKEAIVIIVRSFLRSFFHFYWQDEWRFRTG